MSTPRMAEALGSAPGDSAVFRDGAATEDPPEHGGGDRTSMVRSLRAAPLVALVGSPILLDRRYKVIRQLGAGSMGIVFLAEDVMLKREAAIKAIDPNVADNPGAVESFLREARALARLRHHNVVQIYAFGQHEDAYFFAMEYVDGENLDTVIERGLRSGETMALGPALEILTGVASGLSAAHARSVIHRDVKPSNIVLERETGRAVLVDFGIARHLEQPTVKASVVAGTPMYMAPEQIRNDGAAMSESVDVYALACTAFELLAGRPVFTGRSAREVMIAAVENPAPLLSASRPAYAALDPVFRRALAKSARDRHASCVELVAELSGTAAAAGLLTPSTPRPVHASEPTALILSGDDGLRRALLREAARAFERAGRSLSFECVTDGEDLLRAFEASPSALVVIDEDNAEERSLAIAEGIRRMRGGVQTKILVLTRAMIVDRQAWQGVAARRLVKPINARALAAAFDRLLED